jgi:hypothetical protein
VVVYELYVRMKAEGRTDGDPAELKCSANCVVWARRFD